VVTTIVVYPTPDTASFLGKLPDETSIADLTLPGTHDTCAFYGGMSYIGNHVKNNADASVPVSQCQQPSTPLARQLLDGEFVGCQPNVVTESQGYDFSIFAAEWSRANL
jgi:hypothetical protein